MQGVSWVVQLVTLCRSSPCSFAADRAGNPAGPRHASHIANPATCAPTCRPFCHISPCRAAEVGHHGGHAGLVTPPNTRYARAIDAKADLPAALPTLDIAEGALDKIFNLYKELLPRMGGYLTEAGALNRSRLQLLLDRVAALEQQTLEMRAQVREVCMEIHGLPPLILL